MVAASAATAYGVRAGYPWSYHLINWIASAVALMVTLSKGPLHAATSHADLCDGASLMERELDSLGISARRQAVDDKGFCYFNDVCCVGKLAFIKAIASLARRRQFHVLAFLCDIPLVGDAGGETFENELAAIQSSGCHVIYFFRTERGFRRFWEWHQEHKQRHPRMIGLQIIPPSRRAQSQLGQDSYDNLNICVLARRGNTLADSLDIVEVYSAATNRENVSSIYSPVPMGKKAAFARALLRWFEAANTVEENLEPAGANEAVAQWLAGSKVIDRLRPSNKFLRRLNWHGAAGPRPPGADNR